MSELTWAQIIKQAIFDLKHSGIHQARDAYSFLFAPEREDDLKAVCFYAGINHEVVRKHALALDIPMRVRMAA
jgi:hypothetical protein